MKKTVCLAVAAAALLAARAEAQQPRRNEARFSTAASEKPVVSGMLETTPSMAQMTPEMWFYQQEMRRYDDPRMAVRRKAEFRAAQRQRRIAAMDWYGFSNLRPTANPTPFSGGVYGPGWTSNNFRRPMEWSGGGRTVTYGVLPIAPWVAGYR